MHIHCSTKEKRREGEGDEVRWNSTKSRKFPAKMTTCLQSPCKGIQNEVQVQRIVKYCDSSGTIGRKGCTNVVWLGARLYAELLKDDDLVGDQNATT